MKRKLLFVASKETAQRNKDIAHLLSDDYEIISQEDLSPSTVNFVRTNPNLDAMVSHIPPGDVLNDARTQLEYFLNLFDHSIDLIGQIKQINPMPVIAYCNVTPLVTGSLISAYIEPSKKQEIDASRIKYALNIAWNKPQMAMLNGQPVKIPNLRINDGFTTIGNFEVNLDEGVKPIFGITTVREYNGFRGKITLTPPYGANDVDLKNPQSMSIYAPKGSVVKIRVEGIDSHAQNIALSIYSALTSYDSNSPKFDRLFENNFS